MVSCPQQPNPLTGLSEWERTQLQQLAGRAAPQAATAAAATVVPVTTLGRVCHSSCFSSSSQVMDGSASDGQRQTRGRAVEQEEPGRPSLRDLEIILRNILSGGREGQRGHGTENVENEIVDENVNEIIDENGNEIVDENDIIEPSNPSHGAQSAVQTVSRPKPSGNWGSGVASRTTGRAWGAGDGGGGSAAATTTTAHSATPTPKPRAAQNASSGRRQPQGGSVLSFPPSSNSSSSQLDNVSVPPSVIPPPESLSITPGGEGGLAAVDVIPTFFPCPA